MRLLLAEDEEELSNALAAILRRTGYSVDAVDNGRDALHYLESGQYDGAILDIMMPQMDGLTVLKTIRSQGNGIPVLLLTAKSEIDDRVGGLDAGADDYLTKPFAMRELLARIRVMLRRREMVTENHYHAGNLSLNTATCELSTDTAGLRLVNKEFQMMEMLMRDQGKVISTEHFFEKIWGLECDTELNVVWVQISNLRKKLKSIGANVQIKASRGVGYYLQEEEQE